jgi:hypothetical protein
MSWILKCCHYYYCWEDENLHVRAFPGEFFVVWSNKTSLYLASVRRKHAAWKSLQLTHLSRTYNMPSFTVIIYAAHFTFPCCHGLLKIFTITMQVAIFLYPDPFCYDWHSVSCIVIRLRVGRSANHHSLPGTERILFSRISDKFLGPLTHTFGTFLMLFSHG